MFPASKCLQASPLPIQQGAIFTYKDTDAFRDKAGRTKGVQETVEAFSGSTRGATLAVVKVTSEDADTSDHSGVERVWDHLHDLLAVQIES